MAILTYHHIGDCPPEQADHPGLWVSETSFDRQLAFLRAGGWKGVTLCDILAALRGGQALPRRWVCLTFDDGWRDNFTRALPILARHGFPATVFMVTGRVRTGPPSGAWDEYLSAKEIAAMMKQSVVFGSHTRTHPRLTSISKAVARVEIQRSRDELSALIGESPAWFCYPYGNFSPIIASIVRDCGYVGAVSTIRDNRLSPDQQYWLPRVMVMGDTTTFRLRYMLSSLYHFIHERKNRRRWRSIARNRTP